MKRLGYGLLGLMPDQLFSLTLKEFTDMVHAKELVNAVNEDREMERTAWFTSLIMSASGNYGKKGVDFKKLYERQYDNEGNLIESKKRSGAFTHLDKDEKDQKMIELLSKFNRDENGTKVE